jgi:lysozyme family protein
MDFDQAFTVLIEHEKGYSDNPKDPGNWTGGKVGVGILKGTKYGIAANTYPDLDIKNLTPEQAKAIYLRDFWNAMKLGLLPIQVRFDMFDTAVHSSVKMASKLLQRAAGVKDDGDIGPITLAAATRIPGDLLDKRFNGQRLRFLADLKVWPDFARGWARRIATNLIDD